MSGPLPEASALVGLDVPPECLPGVRAALDGLVEHLRILEEFEIPEDEAA